MATPLDPQPDQPISDAVVRAVADADGISPLYVHPPLATVIDPDALDRVVASMARGSGGSTSRVEFLYNGYVVTVTGQGNVVVAERDERIGSPTET